jgi:hypothetical protein
MKRKLTGAAYLGSFGVKPPRTALKSKAVQVRHCVLELARFRRAGYCPSRFRLIED